MEIQIISVVVLLVVITALYKFLPYREMGDKKPFFALFPKYIKVIECDTQSTSEEEILSGLGFKKVKQDASITKYTRGSVLGDISIKLSKVDVYLRSISPTEMEVAVQARWVAAFDTGDHWQFLSELSKKLENA
ncbi:hypothetical protein [Marinomonas sp. THO17]|uniref:hypothetical protein n=1 Tax=Marinomonas sp. THO17 TaxID=3149048 RepID=UPI00336C1DDD